MRAFLGNNCAKGCFIYLFALVLIVVLTSVGLSGLGAKFGAAQVQGSKSGLTIPSADQALTVVQDGLASVSQDGMQGGGGGGGGTIPTPVSAPPPTIVSPQTGPQPTAAPPPPQQGQGGTITGEASPPFYIVQPGDSLWLIAHKLGVDIDALRAANNISGDLIYPGQVIYLPTSGQPAAPAPPTVQPQAGSQSATDALGDNGGAQGQDNGPVIPSMPDTGITSRRP